MKKKKLVILSVLLCFVLSGCGSRSGEKVMSLNAIDIPEETSGEPTGSGRQEEGAGLPSGSTAGEAADGEEVSGGESGSGQGYNNQPDSSSRPEAGDTKGTEAAAEPKSTQEPEDTGYDFTMCFAGDINLDENWCTTQFMSAQENGIYDCISEELVTAMQEADIMCLNNEFTYSTGGAPLPNKLYTFRANPERVEVLHQLGVDVVTLANNHVYDYGPESMLDTFDVLEEAEIPYFGAGRTLADARKPLYLEIQGKTVALVGASRAEKYKMTPQATDTEPGILRCYDPELFLETIREAKENSDFCIAFVHWGKEDSFELEEVMPETGRQYLDAGADAIIGAHPHRLQAMEYYDGKPIIYSLGNYWFNEETLDTMLIRLHFTGDDASSQLTVQVIPAVQAGYKTTYASDAAEQRRIYDFLEGLSPNVSISDEGIVSEVR
ncbi:MAG: CapA family protein [Lachnospiraceae bacterium]|nr:CapA family protein [Lachnospiraceae bacterium]